MTKLKVGKSRGSNQKSPLVLYSMMEAHSKRLGKELKALERRNQERQNSMLSKTLAAYGADNVKDWLEQFGDVNNMLNERWSAVQEKLMILEQKRAIMMWGKNFQPDTSIVAKRSRQEETIAIRDRTGFELSSDGQNARDGLTEKGQSEFKVDFNFLVGCLGQKLGTSQNIINGNVKNGKNHSIPFQGNANSDHEKSPNTVAPPLTPTDNDESAILTSMKDSSLLVSNNGNEEVWKNISKEADDDSEFEGLPLELSNNPALLVAQAKAMERRYFKTLAKPIRLGFLLERSDDQPFWGMTLSLFDRSCLIVGHVHRRLLQEATKNAKASYKVPSSMGVNPTPDRFLGAFRETLEGPHELKSGDVILSINGRPAYLFPTLLAVTEYMKRFRSVCLVALRAQEIPTGYVVDDASSYEFTKDCYKSLRKNTILSTVKGSMKTAIQKARRRKLHKGKVPLSVNENATNQMLKGEARQPIPYDMECKENHEAGLSEKDCLSTRNEHHNFHCWLASRKKTWRGMRKGSKHPNTASLNKPIFVNEQGQVVFGAPCQVLIAKGLSKGTEHFQVG